MLRFHTSILTAACITLLAACGQDSDSEQAPAASMPTSEAAMADPANPFADAEMTMSRRMMEAIGADISDTWVKQMIEHHRGAIAMSEIVLANNPGEHVRMMAQETISKQRAENEKLSKLVSSSPAAPLSLEPYRTPNKAMQDAMMAAKGDDPSQTYLRKMLEHHRGGVALSDVVLAQGKNAKIRQQAQKTRADQAKETRMVEDLLAGKPMVMSSPVSATTKASAPSTPKATSTPKAPSAPASPKRDAPTPKATPPATSSPAADPHAGHDMNNMKM